MGNSGLGMSSLGPEATVKVYGAEADRLARRRGRTPPLFAILDYAPIEVWSSVELKVLT